MFQIQQHKAAVLAALLAVIVSCENDDGITVIEEVPEDRALSAGTSTTFFTGSGAYDNEARQRGALGDGKLRQPHPLHTRRPLL